MQKLLSLCIRNLLERVPCIAIIRPPCIFMRICSKVIDPNDISSLEEDVTMLMFEIHMSPSFFNIMSHMVVHIVEELEV